MKVQKPVRLLLFLVVLGSVYVARLRASNLTKAIELSNGVQGMLTTKIVAEMDMLLKDLRWEEMLLRVDSFFSDSQFDRVPTLFSIKTDVLVERAKSAATTLFVEYRQQVLQSQRTIIDSRLPTISEITMNNLRVAMSQYTSDAELLETFERNMALVSGSIAETADHIITANTQQRLERLQYIFDGVIEWKMLTYRRFLYHVLRIRVEMNPGSQLETWVELETQQILADKHMTGYLQTAMFERYVGNSAAFIAELEKKYDGESDVYADLDEFFSRRASAVTSILKSQYARVFTIRLEAIKDDAVLDDSQKRLLSVYAMDERERSESANVIVSTSIGEIRSLYLEYGERLLLQFKVFVLAAFLEYEAISFRAMAEGRQTCIIQFFEMRQAIDAPFLFEYSKERGFDLQLARTDFTSAFDLAMESAGANMLSLARTGRILYMYDEARSFVLARANIFFRDDNIVLAAVKPLLLQLHDDYASIVPVRLQQGIEQELPDETTLARAYVDSTFSAFTVNMEFSLVAEMISGARDSIVQDVVGKTDFLHEDFGRLTTELVTESLSPFDFAWFNAQAEEFVTDDEIRYIDLREHVTDQTNLHAIAVMQQARLDYTTQIDSLFDKVKSFVGDVVADLALVIDATTSQDDTSLQTLRSLLNGMEDSMSSLAATIQASTLVKLEASLSDAMQELEEVQGVRLKNFLDTKIQLIKDDFSAQVTGRVVEVYQRHLDSIETNMLEISTMARNLYRENVDELFELERSHRLEVEEVVAPVLEEQAAAILADYNIVSFGNRQALIEQDMRNKAAAAASEVTSQRRLAKLRFERKWRTVTVEFRKHFLGIAEESKLSFRQDVIVIVNDAKALAIDIMGHVADVIAALEREIFSALENAYSAVIDTVIGTNENDLPETLELESVVSSEGIMSLTETPVIPALAFAKDAQEEGPDTEYDEDGIALPSVDEPSGLTTLDIVLLLMPWDDWLQGKVREQVAKIVFEMQEGLTQNTCRHNKPPCREGWVQYTNSWGVECCRFDPKEQGFPAWAITKMLAKEILLALVLDLGSLIEGSVFAAKKLGQSKLGIKASAKGKQLLASSMNKFAGKSSKSMTKAIKLAKTVKGRAMKKVAKKMGTKVGVKIGKVGAKLALGGTKLMAKLSLGPLGIALMIFDVVSLILDLWDPAGYNDAQVAGEIRVERDQIEKYYSEELANDGFDTPLLADTMFNMSPEQQEELQYSAIMGWFEGEVATFQTKNEAALELLPDSEKEAAISAEYERLQDLLNEDINLATTLIAAKLENVFLQDVSVRESHANPFTDGGKDSSRKHTRKDVPASGLMEIVLNETGVEAFNRFQKKKAAFVTSLKWNPMKRFVKRENDYYITADVVSAGFYLKRGEQAVPQFKKVYNENRNIHNPFSPTLIDVEVYPPIRPEVVKNRPTIQGSRDFAASLPSLLGPLKARILNMADKGWTLVDVDAEDEFWAQYDPDKSEDELLDRTTYQASHEKKAQAARAAYELLVDTYISIILEENAPADAEDVNVDHLKVVHLALSTENWSTDENTGKQVLKYPVSDDVDDLEKTVYTLETLPVIPAWALTYTQRREEATEFLQSSFSESHAVEQAELVAAYDDSQTAESGRIAKRASQEGKTEKEVMEEEQAAGRNADASQPDFAVFLHGYGQSSPLYSIFEKCQAMGHGVKYNAEKGLCNFTKEYCKRYGLDFFYNADLGVYDCELRRTQAALEFIFGTTITRSAKRALGAAPVKNAVVGSCRKALGSTRIYRGVAVKHVENAESSNNMQTRAALKAIKTLGLSGF